MNLETLNLPLLFPESLLGFVLLVGLLVEILMPASSKRQSRIPSAAAWGGALAAFFAVLTLSGEIGSSFGGMFLLDPFSTFFKAFFALTAIAVIQMGREHFRPAGEGPAEFYFIILCTLIGLFVLVSANDFLLFFVALEIVTLSFYILSAFAKKDILSIEAGLKYLIIGSMASACLIFGISLLYFTTGTTAFPAIRDALAASPQSPMLLLGILLILAGVGFKAGLFPFQFWIPDVYQGAPTPVVSFLSVASKAAGFAVLMRLFLMVFTSFEQHIFLFSLLAVATLAYGNFGALAQTNIKRLFGYSSIAHAGYLLIGLALGKAAGAAAVLYYLITYAVGTLAVFTILTVTGRQLQSDELTAYRGLAKRSPFLAGALFLAVLSSAGVPPLAGFSGKFFILLAAAQADFKKLALIGAMMVAVSLYYYLGIIRTLYFEDAARANPLEVGPVTRAMIWVLSAGILVIGIWQAPFMGFAQNAARFLF